MKNNIYVVTAYRWGDYESHSYVVGVFDKEERAIETAKIEEEFRGGKYECEVLEGKMNTWVEEDNRDAFKVIKRR